MDIREQCYERSNYNTMNIPTAEELYNDFHLNENSILEGMKLFAKLHVQAQTEAILEKLALRGEHSTLDKNIIANAYQLTNIK